MPPSGEQVPRTTVVVAVVTTVVVVVETVENVEVTVRSFKFPNRCPTPAPTSIAATSKVAIISFLMPSEGSPMGRIVLLVRTA